MQTSDTMASESSHQLRLPVTAIDPIVNNKIEEIDRCPQCECLLKFSAPEVPNQICRSCGYVIGTEAPVGSIEEITENEDVETDQSWSEFYAITNSTEKQVAAAFEEIESVAEDLYLTPELREQAADVYAEASRENLTDGRPTTLVVGAAICIGTREVEQPRPTERVASKLDIDSDRIKQMIRQFQAELTRGYVELSPTAYVGYLCEEAALPEQIKSQAEQLIDTVTESEVFSNTAVHPVGITGAAIYMVSSGELTQRRIATLTGVSQETIRQRVSDFQEAMDS
jgi:Transcription initiation factor TFIIIB, Brf1 subunit/Transcription initiation factor TFIIB